MAPMKWKDALKSALMALGVQSVTIFGLGLMPRWCAVNWDTLEHVSIT